MIHARACSRAGAPTDRLVADIHGTVGSRRNNVGVTAWERLIDIVVHRQTSRSRSAGRWRFLRRSPPLPPTKHGSYRASHTGT
jgi:hypothetical protein